MKERYAVLFALTVALLSVAGVAQACVPSVLVVDVGVTLIKSRYQVTAPGSARLMHQGATCMGYELNGTIRISQHSPRVDYVQMGQGVGEWITALDAPAQPGSCYSSNMTAEGAFRVNPLTGSDSGGPSCWNAEDELPQPDPSPRNCTPIWDAEGQTWVDAGCDTPVLLNLGTGDYELTSAANGVRFDIRNDGQPRRIAWTSPQSDVAFLALDRDGNGVIDSGAELFGNATRLASGARAAHGFEALAELDANADGLLSPTDPVWSSLLLWTDRNHDGVSGSGEMQHLTDSEVAWIATSYNNRVNRRDQWGNLFRYMSRAGLRTHARETVRQVAFYDVFLKSESL